ncbi:ATP-binding cassette domain-containing protein [bacterium]|nr:ATP-binding cassette domain-containing protein [bacterium]|tara:strand:- start:3620 stop:4270 length:651 start_codon:yes stop_codon:yes gene_type:complete
MIEINNLSKNVNGKQILKDISFKIFKSDFVSIVGPSGSGKTTLLNILLLITNKTSGKYFFNDKDMEEIFNSSSETRKFRSQIGIMSAFSELLRNFTVKENIILPSIIEGIAYSKEYYEKLTNDLQISNILDENISTLSSGEKQRVLLARALILNPTVLIADEPTSNLDSDNAIKMIDILSNLNEENKTTIIIATHDDKIYDRTDSVYRIEDGKIRV